MSTGLEAQLAEVLAKHKAVRVEDLVRRDGSFTCACGSSFTGGPTGYRAHQAAMLAPIIREAKAEALKDGLKWISEAVTEATQNAPAPSGTPDLASAYWDGYRAASREIIDLLTEPKIHENAIASSNPHLGPDCLAKKCRACDGRALDLDTDEIIHCQCPCHT